MKPTDRLTDAGDVARVERMSAALVLRLRADPRVLAAYHDVAQMGDAAVAAGMPDEDALRAAMRRRIEALVRDELCRPWPWLAALLQRDVMAWLLGQLAGAPLVVALEAPDLPDLPRGRAPKADDYLTRDVDWFYRVRVKSPPEAIKALAGAYARDIGRHTDARSVVQTAIRRIDRLLGTLDTDPL